MLCEGRFPRSPLQTSSAHPTPTSTTSCDLMKVHGTDRAVHHALQTNFLLLDFLGPLLSWQPLTRSRPLTGKPHYILEDLVLPILLGGHLLPHERCWTGTHLQRFFLWTSVDWELDHSPSGSVLVNAVGFRNRWLLRNPHRTSKRPGPGLRRKYVAEQKIASHVFRFW